MIPILLASAVQFQPYFAAACNNKATFFFIPAWYEFLTVGPDPTTGTCGVQNFTLPHDLLPFDCDFLLVAAQ